MTAGTAAGGRNHRSEWFGSASGMSHTRSTYPQYAGAPMIEELTMTWKTFHSRGEILRDGDRHREHPPRRPPAHRRRRRRPRPSPTTWSCSGPCSSSGTPAWPATSSASSSSSRSTSPLAVATAWGSACDELPGVRLVLDHYRAEPIDEAMARAMAKATAQGARPARRDGRPGRHRRRRGRGRRRPDRRRASRSAPAPCTAVSRPW